MRRKETEYTDRGYGEDVQMRALWTGESDDSLSETVTFNLGLQG